MAESTSSSHRSSRQAVAASAGTTTFAVHRAGWSSVAPHLAPHLAELLAEPIAVSSAPRSAAPGPVEPRRAAEQAGYRRNMPSVPPYGKHRRAARMT